MNIAKSILSIAAYGVILLGPALASADNDKSAFQTDKERHIAKILERIQIEQKNLSCLQNAQDEPSLNACVEMVKQTRESAEPKPVASACDKKPEKAPNNKKKK